MRTELIHPLVVHFPLALLLTGVVLRLCAFFLKKRPFASSLLWCSWILLFLGSGFAWLAVCAGELAEDIVRRGLCKPDILEHHKDLAYTAATLFSIGILIDLAKAWIKPSHPRAVATLMALIYLSGTVFLIIVGGYGANLVYEQGAAVENICNPKYTEVDSKVGRKAAPKPQD